MKMCGLLAAAVAVQSVFWPGVLSARATGSIKEHGAFSQRAMRRLQKVPTEWSPTCPYGDKAASLQGGPDGFQCHWKSKGRGNTCPELELKRMEVARRFFLKEGQNYLNAAVGYGLEELFDKSALLRGDETYEELAKMHINMLNHKDVSLVEDKILFKDLAAKLGVPTTKTLFGAHKSDWERSAFGSMLASLCAGGVDGFMVKAVHLAWSKGQRVIKGFQAVCKDAQQNASFVEELADFVEAEVLGQVASDQNTHLRDFVEPGVIVEELWVTGGSSVRPLEVKVQCLWGKVHHMFLLGDDARGCAFQVGAMQLYADKTGWDFKGIVGPVGTNDAMTDHFLRFYFDDVKSSAEAFCSGVGADLMRADYFIGLPESGEALYAMNEPESVSGHPYWFERHQMGTILRDGYILSDRLKMTPKKWDEIMARANVDRDTVGLEVPP